MHDFSSISEYHNSLLGFYSKSDIIKRNRYFFIPNLQGFRTIQNMMSGFTGLLLRTHDPSFTKTAPRYALQNTLQPPFFTWYISLKKMHDSMGQVVLICKNDDFLFVSSIKMTVIVPKFEFFIIPEFTAFLRLFLGAH